MYDGYLNFGGNEIGNNARSWGYAWTADCPMAWFKGEVCDGMWDALAETDLYTYANISKAPWYDSANADVSSRFFGVWIVDVEGVENSTRRVSLFEGISDGGVLGPTRKAAKTVTVKAVLIAQGEDALGYGMAWLSAVLDPGACGQHGSGCGTTDLAFWAACPPARADITKPQTNWSAPVTNLATNPSFEAGATAAVVRTNLAINPSFESVTASTAEVRRNLQPRPFPAGTAGTVGTGGWLSNNAAQYAHTIDDVFVHTPGVPSMKATRQAATPTGVLMSAYAVGATTYSNAGSAVVTSGSTYVFSVWWAASVANCLATMNVSWWDSGGVQVGSTVVNPETGPVTRPVNTWFRREVTLTAPANAVSARMSVNINMPTGVTVGGELAWIADSQIEFGSVATPWFSGNTLPAGDFTYAWTGTANASPPVEYGLKPSDFPVSNQSCVAISSSEWALTGTKSLRVIPKAATNNSTAYSALSALGLVEGKTYTAMATCRIVAPQTGTLNTRARTISLAAGGTSPQAPNLPGVYPLRFTFTIDGTTVTLASALSLYNGASVGNGEVWWDDLLIVEGTYTGPYFDGSTPAKVRRNLASNSAPVSISNWSVAGGSFDNGWAKSVAPSPITAYIFTQTAAQAVKKGEVVTLGVEYVVDELGSGTVPAAINFQPHMRASNTYLSPRSHRPIVVGQVERVVLTWTADRDIAANDLDIALLSASANGSNTTAPTGFTYRARHVVIEPGTTDGSWFDGSTPLSNGLVGGWEGTANNSPSYLTDPDFTYAWSGAANLSASTQSIPTVAVYGSGASTDGQSSAWSSDRGKSLRIISQYPSAGSAFVDIANQPAPRGLEPGKTYTLSAVLRMDAVQGAMGIPAGRSLQLTGTTGGYNVTVAGQDQIGEQLLTMTFTIPPTGVWYLRLYNGAKMGGPDVWFDDLIITEGDTVVPYFDGEYADSIPDEVVGQTGWRYTWTGAVDGSTSTFERATVVSVEDPDTWAELVSDLRRYLHDVGAVSGPLVTEEMQSGPFFGYAVEFTFIAEKPWVYKITRPIDLPPSLPVVVQDIPFNLAPYPSAELASGTVVVATNYAPNPSVETDATGWTTAGDGTVILNATLAGARSTELASAGAASFRTLFTATGASAVEGYFQISHTVPLPHAVIAGERYSVSMWTTRSTQAGAPVYGAHEVRALWQDAASVTLRTDVIGAVPAGGGAVALKSIAPPAGATKVVVRAYQYLTSWNAGTIVRLYADAVAVSVP